MFRLRSRVSTQPADQFRTRLRLESLEWRDQPSGLMDDNRDNDPPFIPSAMGNPANNAPVIMDFTWEESGNHLILFTGRVVDEAPGGLTITFSSGIPEIDGKTVTTDADGNFEFLVRVSFGGIVTATTVDAQGQVSNEAITHVSPTPPPP